MTTPLVFMTCLIEFIFVLKVFTVYELDMHYKKLFIDIKVTRL